MTYDLITHLQKSSAFSRITFGPGERTEGVCDHIRKELREITTGPDDGLRSREWVDVAILAFDGLCRALEAEGHDPDAIPMLAASIFGAKQLKNMHRTWPDWRDADPDKAIEHIRGGA